MRYSIAASCLLLSLTCLCRADDGQAFLGVFAETTVMQMAGMPKMPDMPELPAGVALPEGMGAIMMPGRPSRRLEVRLWSPGAAPNDASAALAIPPGLKLGPKLDLALYRPEAVETAGDLGPEGTPPDFTIKRYWGSSATVKDGQPEVFRWDGLTTEQKAVLRAQAESAKRQGTTLYRPGYTTAHWPNAKRPSAIDKAASLPGHYALTSSYTGNVEIDVPAGVDFLAPIELTAPNLEKQVDLTKPITFKWKAIPRALGLHAQIIGIVGKNTMIIWTSSEAKSDLGVSFDYMQMADVTAGVKATTIMEPARVEVTVPAGIFADCDVVMMQMIGYGPGTALDKAQPLPRVQTKTTLMVMLGGKQMRDMLEGFDEE